MFILLGHLNNTYSNMHIEIYNIYLVFAWPSHVGSATYILPIDLSLITQGSNFVPEKISRVYPFEKTKHGSIVTIPINNSDRIIL